MHPNIEMGGLTKPQIVKIITDHIANEANIESIIQICLDRMKESLAHTDVVTLSTDDKIKLTEMTSQHAEINARIAQVEKENVLLHNRLRAASNFSDLLERRIDDGDQYTRRLNLLVDGVPTKRGESPDSIRTTLVEEFKRLGCAVADFEIDRAHRAENPFYDRDGVRQQAVIVRFISWSARDRVYQQRKESTLRFRPDMTERRRDILHAARRDASARDALSGKRIVDFVGMDKNCRLFMRAAAGRMLHFSSEQEFDHCYRQLEDSCPDLAPLEDLSDDRGRFDTVDQPDVPAAVDIAVDTIAHTADTVAAIATA